MWVKTSGGWMLGREGLLCLCDSGASSYVYNNVSTWTKSLLKIKQIKIPVLNFFFRGGGISGVNWCDSSLDTVQYYSSSSSRGCLVTLVPAVQIFYSGNRTRACHISCRRANHSPTPHPHRATSHTMINSLPWNERAYKVEMREFLGNEPLHRAT